MSHRYKSMWSQFYERTVTLSMTIEDVKDSEIRTVLQKVQSGLVEYMKTDERLPTLDYLKLLERNRMLSTGLVTPTRCGAKESLDGLRALQVTRSQNDGPDEANSRPVGQIVSEKE
ncbi:hypothetical protein DFP72DRAFT_1077754 [Ephemerocybe angulata]|uniref:Uncharacterized protein n=1 Tax=Ephemerocybe angulata TaxID=980116 RepID=A0A8H6LYE5_9AGAR|nr:hypothetical protein DFP72DRAFT_1077754 [Tulosesus angulatus]